MIENVTWEQVLGHIQANPDIDWYITCNNGSVLPWFRIKADTTGSFRRTYYGPTIRLAIDRPLNLCSAPKLTNKAQYCIIS